MRRIPSPLTIGLTLVLGASLGVAPAAAQDDTYEAALASGDLSSLVPAAFADAEDMTVATLAQSMPPAEMDTDEGAAAREDLTALLDAAGVTLADAQSYTGITVDGEDVLTFSADRFPGVAAADWFEPVFQIAFFRNFTDPVREVVNVGPKEVLRITDRGTDRSRLFYPQGEILWSLTNDGALAMAFLEGLETVAGPALSVDPGASVDGEPVATVGTADDPLSQIPTEIRGVETVTQTMPAAVVIEGASGDDAEVVQAFTALLESLGGVDKATFISSQAIGDDGGVAIAGVTVEGADQAAFVEALLETLVLPSLESPEITEETLGGKPVLRVAEGDSFAGSATYVYGVGGTVWLLNGQEEWIAELLRTMP